MKTSLNYHKRRFLYSVHFFWAKIFKLLVTVGKRVNSPLGNARAYSSPENIKMFRRKLSNRRRLIDTRLRPLYIFSELGLSRSYTLFGLYLTIGTNHKYIYIPISKTSLERPANAKNAVTSCSYHECIYTIISIQKQASRSLTNEDSVQLNPVYHYPRINHWFSLKRISKLTIRTISGRRKRIMSKLKRNYTKKSAEHSMK